MISNFIYRVNAVDYKYLYKEYPDLKEYVEAYNKVCESSVGDEIGLQDIEDIIKKKNQKSKKLSGHQEDNIDDQLD